MQALQVNEAADGQAMQQAACDLLGGKVDLHMHPRRPIVAADPPQTSVHAIVLTLCSTALTVQHHANCAAPR